jgi:hypothetical protein
MPTARHSPRRNSGSLPKPLEVIQIKPPPVEQRTKRDARLAAKGEKANRYNLPEQLASGSPVGFRKRVSLTVDEAKKTLAILALKRPSAFAQPKEVREEELFEECSLGVMLARQSTNFRGHRDIILGPNDSKRLAAMLRSFEHLEAPVLDRAAYTHVVWTRPYRTPFTMLLTFAGHLPFISPVQVAWRALTKRYFQKDDIPTIGYLQYLHLGILADVLERAVVLASSGQRRAQVLLHPFLSKESRQRHRKTLRSIEQLCGLTRQERQKGWRLGLVAQVGQAVGGESIDLPPDLCRRLGANFLAFRSERIQPGVNQADNAPDAYQYRQDMDVPEALTMQAGRAAYNAFAHFSGCNRERAKDLLLMDRIDVLTPNGKERLRAIRRALGEVTDRLAKNLPLWADLPTGRLFSRNVRRGRKAFALVGQRIYIGGLSASEIQSEGLDWRVAVASVGAAAARSSLWVELMGCVDLPDDCDLLGGVCLMAGPVNQNDIGKQFYGRPDLLAETYEGRNPTSLLVWTFKAKTVADPIGNEEQLLNPKRKGALVDLRPSPHEVVGYCHGGKIIPMRQSGGRTNAERAFYEQGNFVTDPEGKEIPGNRGSAWPEALRRTKLWANETGIQDA